MRGRPENNGSLWYSITVEDLIETGHPLRAMKRMVDEPLLFQWFLDMTLGRTAWTHRTIFRWRREAGEGCQTHQRRSLHG